MAFRSVSGTCFSFLVFNIFVARARICQLVLLFKIPIRASVGISVSLKTFPGVYYPYMLFQFLLCGLYRGRQALLYKFQSEQLVVNLPLKADSYIPSKLSNDSAFVPPQ